MEENFSLHAKAYFNLLKTGSWIEKNIKEALKPFGITHAQLNVLYILFRNYPTPVSANELKSQMLVSNPDVTRLLDRLVQKNYVIRETCPVNRRKIDISLTEDGVILFKKAHKSTKESVGNFFENKLTENEAKQLRRLLHKIMD